MRSFTAMTLCAAAALLSSAAQAQYDWVGTWAFDEEGCRSGDTYTYTSDKVETSGIVCVITQVLEDNDGGYELRQTCKEDGREYPQTEFVTAEGDTLSVGMEGATGISLIRCE